MSTLVELYVLAGLFLVVNFLDAFTTYLNLFKLEPGLEGKEMNPVFGDIKKNFKGAMSLKALIVIVGLWLFLTLFINSPGQGIFIFSILDLTFGFVILNNLYVYLSKKMRKKKVTSPIGYVSLLFQKVIPKRAADIVSYYVVVLALITVSVIIISLQ